MGLEKRDWFLRRGKSFENTINFNLDTIKGNKYINDSNKEILENSN